MSPAFMRACPLSSSFTMPLSRNAAITSSLKVWLHSRRSSCIILSLSCVVSPIVGCLYLSVCKYMCNWRNMCTFCCEKRSGRMRQGVNVFPVACARSGRGFLYQITTRSAAGRNMGWPSSMPKAAKKGSMLRSVALTRQRPSEWGSVLVRWRISASRMFPAHTLA